MERASCFFVEMFVVAMIMVEGSFANHRSPSLELALARILTIINHVLLEFVRLEKMSCDEEVDSQADVWR